MAAAPDPKASPPKAVFGLQFFPAPWPSGGATIRSVAAGSPAAMAGLRPKDVIVQWQGVEVREPADLEGQERSPARQFTVAYLRENEGGLQERSATVDLDGGRRSHVAVVSARLEHQGRSAGTPGIIVRASIEAGSYAARTLELRARVEEMHGGGFFPLTAASGEPILYKAQIEPSGDTFLSGEIPIFIPYGDLPSGTEERALRVVLTVTDESGRELASSAPMPFLLKGS